MATIILKVTDKCNSNCIYCDSVFKRAHAKSMHQETLEFAFIRMNSFLESCTDEKITLIWHGGEPLLQGAGFYQAAFDMQENICRHTKSRIEHCIQSNLTLFTEDFVDVFRKLNISQIGTSYDPHPHVRGPGERIASEEYNQMFMQGIRLLERQGFEWGVIYVVTKMSLSNALDIFFFLTNLRPDGGINLNPVLIYDEQRTDIAVTPQEYADFLGAIFPTWWRHRNRYPNFEPFRSLSRCIIDKKLSLACIDSGSCAHNHVHISPDGEASQCGRSSDWDLLQYGNIRERTLQEIFHDSQRMHLMQRGDFLRKTECRDCRFWMICHGGCPLDAYSTHKNYMHKSEWCEMKKTFIEKYFEPVTGVVFEPYEE
jgi:uncharacterized protein